MPPKIALLPVLLVMILAISGCSGEDTDVGISVLGNTPEQISRQEFMLNTIIKITVYDKANQAQLDGAVELCRHYENLLSRTIEGSDVWRINHAGGQPVAVDADTIELLAQALEYSRISDGVFDVTMYPVILLWDFSGETSQLPDQTALDEALTHVDWTRVKLDGNTVQLAPGMGIDLGGIAKGFIADKVREYLASNGVESALINLGGNVLTLGKRTDGVDFTIGVRKPFGKQTEIVGAVRGHDMSVVTSGVYERYFNLDGKLYHHILSPRDGYPVNNGINSVTIISQQSAAGDALGTVCFELGEQAGMELIETLDNTEAIFILEDGTFKFSSGVSDMWVPESEL